ncbi:MAG: pilus assembly protein N-terminal domain-containing protein [Candidatus Eremiobacteraeota bacterium]|nr:pilus assembly protein N-terminal domain-containing protein [Candidatus Eremiobacteraeota bacterium]
MRRVLAPLTSLAAVCALALAAAAQVNPPAPPPSGPVNPPGNVATPVPVGPNTPAPSPAETPGTQNPPGTFTPAPLASPTQPPIIVEPPQISVEPGKTVTGRVNSSLGTLTATVADPAIATVIVDPAQRILYVTGLKVGTTTATVTDARSVQRDVPIRVAYAAGSAADQTSLRVTGNPTSSDYLREAVALAVTRAATLRSGASINVPLETIPVRGNLKIDDRLELDVPSQIAGNGYLPVNGTTHVLIENTALPSIQPARLLVSDYPERLTANGVLFTARLDRTQAQRFLYYHFNPANEPSRRILLKARNSSTAPATVQMIDGSAGPGTNEMEVGHLSTKRFLVREARNEGQVMTIAPGATINLVDHPLPAANVISAILQLRLVSGDPLDLTLVAQDALAPTDQSIDTVQLLAGGAPHARGVYPVPTFFFERTYDVDGADLDIPIGQLPLPNLREGEALSGDYGVEQSMNVVVVNMTRGPRSIALYANPRGGRATGTFLIDGTLVQAHALAAFSRFKIWQETINAGTFRRIRIVTMPEGGSSYPLRLTFAQDDGSVGPGAPGSPIY